MTAWRIAHDPNRHSYADVALTPIEDDEDETFDYLTKTDGAKAAIDHLKKIAELTHKVPAAAPRAHWSQAVARRLLTAPPSTTSDWPVTKSLSLEARNTSAPSRSSG